MLVTAPSSCSSPRPSSCSSPRPSSCSPPRLRHARHSALVMPVRAPSSCPSERPSSCSLQRPCHEDVVRAGPVVAERLAVGEAEPLVEGARRLEELGGAGLQAQPPQALAPRLPDDVRQQTRADAAAAPRRRGAHGLELRMGRVEPFDGAAADESLTVPDRPERDGGLAQAVKVEGILAFEGRDRSHLPHVVGEELGYLRPGEVVHHNLHAPTLGRRDRPRHHAAFAFLLAEVAFFAAEVPFLPGAAFFFAAEVAVLVAAALFFAAEVVFLPGGALFFAAEVAFLAGAASFFAAEVVFLAGAAFFFCGGALFFAAESVFFSAAVVFLAGADLFSGALSVAPRCCLAASTLRRSTSIRSWTAVASGGASAIVISAPSFLASMSSL